MSNNMTEVCEVLKRTLRVDRIPEMDKYYKRIEETEDQFADMARCVGKYATITEKLAHRGEKLASAIGICSSDQESKNAFKSNLANYTRHLSTIQTQRSVLKDILNGKISSDLTAYEGKCLQMKKSVKACENAVRKKNHRFLLLQKAKNKTPVDPRNINDANIKFEKARCEAERSCEDVKMAMKHFEEQKWKDLHHILGDFLLAEMHFHAQALQGYTAAFKCLPLLSEGDDVDRPRGNPRGNSRESSRDKRERRVAFSGSDDDTRLPVSQIDLRRRSDSSDSKLSIRDLN